MATLGFRTNSKLEKLIGRELITNNTIAFFELVKNSYDAGANKVEIHFENFISYTKEKNKYLIDGEKVNPNTVISNKDSRITIKDDGKGMSFEEVKNYWMEIGTVHKENEREISISNVLNNSSVRKVNGEKGIGRFGTDKLGAHLILNAIDSNCKEQTIVNFDWNKYNDHSKLIEEISHEYTVSEVFLKSSGLTLEISELRDEWTIRDIERLKEQFKKFVSPFSQEQNLFSIYIKYNEFKEKILNDVLVNSKVFIEGNLSSDGNFEYNICDDDQQITEIINQSPPSFGPVNFKVIYMDMSTKTAFTKKMGITSREYGNIKLFRDNFRVFPYGEKENDWLGIDNKHAQGVFRTFGTRDLIGYVQITNDKNNELKDATNRLGLIEDSKAFIEFKEFIWKCINLLENYVFNEFKKKSRKNVEIIEEKVQATLSHSKDLKKNIVDTIKNENISQVSADKIIKLIENSTSKMEKDYAGVRKANSELKKQIKVYERISGSEEMLYELLHTIMNKTAILGSQLLKLKVQAQINNLEIDNETISITLKSINDLLSSALRKASSNKLEKSINDLTVIIKESLQEVRPLIEDKNIILNTKILEDSLSVMCNKESIKIVLDNLFSNAFKALNKVSYNKIITIETLKIGRQVEIYFSDNGIGINEEDKHYIFNVGFSRTTGNGMGLATTLDILEDSNGDISLVELNSKDISTSFKITLPLMER